MTEGGVQVNRYIDSAYNEEHSHMYNTEDLSESLRLIQGDFRSLSSTPRTALAVPISSCLLSVLVYIIMSIPVHF